MSTLVFSRFKISQASWWTTQIHCLVPIQYGNFPSACKPVLIMVAQSGKHGKRIPDCVLWAEREGIIPERGFWRQKTAQIWKAQSLDDECCSVQSINGLLLASSLWGDRFFLPSVNSYLEHLMTCSSFTSIPQKLWGLSLISWLILCSTRLNSMFSVGTL